ncbi:MAG: GxxExxY protein [Bacteroidales bacterium]|nr:GxxExxY protein [Bacteroidales bacterium]
MIDKMRDITYDIINCAIEVHRRLGPGLLESVYQKALVHELKLRNFEVESELSIDVEYKGINVANGLRLDILIDGEVIVELKSVENVLPVHKKQLLTYLKLLDVQVGLLINFNVCQLREGITRIVNNYEE